LVNPSCFLSIPVIASLFIRTSSLAPLPPARLPLAPSFFFKATAPTELSTLSLHDALPISRLRASLLGDRPAASSRCEPSNARSRSEEHTSELQSRVDLVCRLLLEKKKWDGLRCMLLRDSVGEVSLKERGLNDQNASVDRVP